MHAITTAFAIVGSVAAVGLAALVVRLRAERARLAHTNELMAKFIALAAHELRTPVTIAHGVVQTLNHLEGQLDEAQELELRVALEQQTARMAVLVEQLLDLSRLDAEAIDVTPRTVELASSLTQMVATAAGERAGEVEIAVSGGAAAIVDAGVLDHILTNLVTNALRYGCAPVRVSAAVSDGRLLVFVEDAGPGVAVEIEQTLFDRFIRAGVARDRVAGTGLGLAIARTYARAHDGDLRYERNAQGGARFVVDLPSAAR
ncbi:MAG TPA: HAMP domain-containing sensor histidine kinase [Gaiellaceae bacterium]|nr:HAMP domain-containing sensor histidine kinase [Gaiellaceae bacterium]